MSDGRHLYAHLLFPKGHGFPLFLPSPPDDLPEPVKREGTRIGDVGIVCTDGSFDPIFNILCPEGHLANRFGVPSGFEKLILRPEDICERVLCHPPGSVISNTIVKEEQADNNTAGGVAMNQMGLLKLSDGASSWDLLPLKVFRDYALKHAANWYTFVNDDLQRLVGNSSLYLATGVTKCTSWSIGAFDDCSGWEWEDIISMLKSGPYRRPGEESWRDNQTLFIRGFKVAVRSSGAPPSIGSDEDPEADEESLSECAPNVYHPSDIINQNILNSVPSATVAVTHDDEWTSVLKETDTEVPDDKELVKRISDKARFKTESHPPPSGMDYEWTVYTTWHLSFDQLSQPAATSLQLCSFLHGDGITEEIFSRAATHTFPSFGPSREALQKPLEFLMSFDKPNAALRTSEDPDEADRLPALSNSESPSPTGTEPLPQHVVTDSGASSWQGSPVIETPEDPPFDLPSLHMVQNRRGSLPINALSSYGSTLVDPLDPLARRRSVDASLVLLAANPYAGIARAKKSALLATQRLSHGRRGQYMQRPNLPHRSTVPAHQHTRHASMDARGFRMPPSPSPSPLSPYHAVRASLPDHSLYPVSSRSIAVPIPGPLPSPGFSFGVANSTPESDRNSPVDFGGFSFPPASDADTEDDSASYQMSRFGSIASESSATSAYFSDVGSTGEAPDFRSARRESCPTGFLNLMSGLDVGGPRRASLAEGLLGNYSSHSEGERDSHGAVGYPSPSSTVSPGDSPRTGTTNSSELNYALHQDVPYPPRSASAEAAAPTFFFDSNNSSNNSYPQSAPATSDEFSDKFHYDYGMPYAPHAESYGPETSYDSDAQGYNNSMDFTPSEPYYEPSHPAGDTPFTYS